MNIGYAMPIGSALFGMYGVALLIFSVATFFSLWRQIKMSLLQVVGLFVALQILFVLSHGYNGNGSHHPPTNVNLVGVQMEFPPENIIPKILDQALAKNTNASIFVLSEYTLDGGVPDSLKNKKNLAAPSPVPPKKPRSLANAFLPQAMLWNNAVAGTGRWTPVDPELVPVLLPSVIRLKSLNTPRTDAAKAFLVFLQAPRARSILRSNGFLPPP